MNLVFATGSDSKLFLNLCILLDSFAHHMPGETLRGCDFGCEDRPRDFLAATGHLTPAPPHLADEPHTWKRKATLPDFFASDRPPPDAVVWFDADMAVLAPVAEDIRALADAMRAAGEAVAACTDSNGGDIAGFIAANETPETGLDPFRALIDAHGTDPGAPYLNTGFFILFPGPFAERWRDEVMRQPPFLLFEQNTFNALAGAPGAGVRILDPGIWNVHGDLLADVDVAGAARILHTTSKGAHHTMSRFSVPIGGVEVSGEFKIFARPDLMKIQGDHLMHFLLGHQDLAAAHGI